VSWWLNTGASGKNNKNKNKIKESPKKGKEKRALRVSMNRFFGVFLQGQLTLLG